MKRCVRSQSYSTERTAQEQLCIREYTRGSTLPPLPTDGNVTAFPRALHRARCGGVCGERPLSCRQLHQLATARAGGTHLRHASLGLSLLLLRLHDALTPVSWLPSKQQVSCGLAGWGCGTTALVIVYRLQVSGEGLSEAAGLCLLTQL